MKRSECLMAQTRGTRKVRRKEWPLVRRRERRKGWWTGRKMESSKGQRREPHLVERKGRLREPQKEQRWEQHLVSWMDYCSGQRRDRLKGLMRGSSRDWYLAWMRDRYLGRWMGLSSDLWKAR